MTELQKFKIALQKRHFNVSDEFCSHTQQLVPSTYRDNDKNLIVTGDVMVSILGGANIQKGQLGCVTFQLLGKSKKYKCRNISEYQAVLKKSFVAKNANHAIQQFDQWNQDVKSELQKWNKII